MNLKIKVVNLPQISNYYSLILIKNRALQIDPGHFLFLGKLPL